METSMLAFIKHAVIAATVAVVLSIPSGGSALANPAQSNIATQIDAISQIQSGDLVHLRSGGPLMIVKSVQGDQVLCAWTEQDGSLRSGSFPLSTVAAPITSPLYSE
jgi:uncharacterized protein YodC (DUF2158 family)